MAYGLEAEDQEEFGIQSKFLSNELESTFLGMRSNRDDVPEDPSERMGSVNS
jgi:hypothetical protein